MTHGIAGYFIERARAARRVSLIALLVGLLPLGVLYLARVSPEFRAAITDQTRFGFEGPEQYVRRIELEQAEGMTELLRHLGNVQPLESRRGGARRGKTSDHPRATPRSSTDVTGPGDSEFDLVSRAVSRRENVPVVRSEDLVIEQLVRPDYPAELLDRNIEGKVMLQALVDTVGAVVDVQVLGSTGETRFEEVAATAVWKCRFRPFKRDGVASEVYAVFRFAFRIYD